MVVGSRCVQVPTRKKSQLYIALTSLVCWTFIVVVVVLAVGFDRFILEPCIMLGVRPWPHKPKTCPRTLVF